MRKLEVADREIMQIGVQQEVQRSEESRYDHRLHGVLLVAQGAVPQRDTSPAANGR